MAKASKTTRGVVLTLIGGTCWGFSGTCAKFLMDGYGVDPVWLVCVRQFFASWLFLALAAAVPGASACACAEAILKMLNVEW